MLREVRRLGSQAESGGPVALIFVSLAWLCGLYLADGLYRGGASFPSLPLDLRSIEVVVPIAYAVPSSWRGPGRSPSPSCSPHRSRPGPP
jgi:hypothetical protein